jgi:hypothetical protein
MSYPTPRFCHILAVLVFTLLAGAVWAIPPTINIQGSLTGTDGKALSGDRVWRVQFYDAETGGNKLGDALSGSLQAGTLGHFSIALTPPAAVLSGSGEVWYEVAVDSAATADAKIDPADLFPNRVAVHSVLFAQRANHALTANTATTATLALKSKQADTATFAVNAASAGIATTATVALSAKTLEGVSAANLATDAELTSALATKADLAHSHNLDALAGSVTDAQVPDSITVNHAATATTATVALKALESDRATTATLALNAKTLEGVSVTALATDAELTSALAAKAALAHSHNLDALGGAVTDAQVPDSITIDHATTATFSVNAGTANTATTATFAATAGSVTTATFSATAGTACQLQGEAFLMVRTTQNPATNATHLLATYSAAKTRTPHGAALSASNRVVIIVPPGQYDLGTGALTLDTEFIDIEGLSKDRDKQHLYGTANGANTGVLMQTANNVRIENLFVECTCNDGAATFSNSDPAAYFPATTLAATVVRNCRFLADDISAWSMRTGDSGYSLEYSGTYEKCVAGDFSFGSNYGVASGTFTHCTGGNSSFGGFCGTASGTFAHCKGLYSAFGGFGGTASGTFTNCTGGNYAFAGGGWANGTFQDCTGGDVAFAGSDLNFALMGTASGTFTRCTGGDESFGSKYTASGAFRDCTGGAYAFGGESVASGTFQGCTGGNYAFGGNGGLAKGSFQNCTGGTYAFGGNGGTAGSSGKFYYCNGGTASFTTTGSPVRVYCIQDGVAY